MSIIPQYRSKKQRNFHHTKPADAASFLDLLSNKELTTIFDNNTPKYRERVYTPMKTLSMFLAQALNEDRSCSKAVNDMIIQSQSTNYGRKISPNTGAYCLARKSCLCRYSPN